MYLRSSWNFDYTPFSVYHWTPILWVWTLFLKRNEECRKLTSFFPTLSTWETGCQRRWRPKSLNCCIAGQWHCRKSPKSRMPTTCWSDKVGSQLLIHALSPACALSRNVTTYTASNYMGARKALRGPRTREKLPEKFLIIFKCIGLGQVGFFNYIS